VVMAPASAISSAPKTRSRDVMSLSFSCRIYLSASLVISLLTFPSGCSRHTNLPGETGTLSGRVTYQDQPVPTGAAVVMVHRERGIFAVGTTSKSGEFSAKMRKRPEILVGEYLVHIVPPGEFNEDLGKPTLDNVPDTWKKIPMKYWTPETSPEKFSVHSGANTYNLILKD